MYLGLGSNLGDRLKHLQSAAAALETQSDAPLRRSSVFETDPVGFLDQPRFLNAVVQMTTALPPRELLRLVNDIERSAGRVRSFPNAPRSLDIDILLFDDISLRDSELEIPHPRMLERAFVLVPLLELDPDVRLPDGDDVKGRFRAETAGGVRLFRSVW